MKTVFCVLGALCFAAPTLAQDIPVLAKKWQGTATSTHAGSGTVTKHAPHHPDAVGPDAAKGWRTFVEPRTLTIVRQQGRHIEASMASPRFESPWVATLSADGRLMQVTTQTGSVLSQLQGDNLTGCGPGHNADGSISATCFELTAGK